MSGETKYNQLQKELDGILAQLQGEQADIDEAMKLYGRGEKIIKELEQHLAKAENTIKRLKLPKKG